MANFVKDIHFFCPHFRVRADEKQYSANPAFLHAGSDQLVILRTVRLMTKMQTGQGGAHDIHMSPGPLIASLRVEAYCGWKSSRYGAEYGIIPALVGSMILNVLRVMQSVTIWCRGLANQTSFQT